MTNERISSKLTLPSKYVDLDGAKMHYIEMGQGRPILFLHGVPTSCYVWRNIMPHLAKLGRCIAPDLIGFGRSDKPNIEYSVFDHVKYLEKFIKALHLDRMILVMHGWGSVIGLDYAMRHEKNCAGLVFYEAFLRSFNREDISLPYQEQLLAVQDQTNAYNLNKNGLTFIDKVLPQTIMRELTTEELKYYREPFVKDGSGKPILQYIKELPTGMGDSKVDDLISQYSEKLVASKLPKLMLYSVPGFMTTFATAMWAKENLSNLEMIDIGEELHLAQEACPQVMGETISVWLQGIEQTKSRG